MLQEQLESAVSVSMPVPELWTNSVGWFNLYNIRQSALAGISGNLNVCSELLFTVVRINQA